MNIRTIQIRCGRCGGMYGIDRAKGLAMQALIIEHSYCPHCGRPRSKLALKYPKQDVCRRCGVPRRMVWDSDGRNGYCARCLPKELKAMEQEQEKINTAKVDCIAREPHHEKHVRAVWDKLPEYMRGRFFSDPHALAASPNEHVLCAAYGDLKEVSHQKKKAIYMEHGAGFYYNVKHASYAGSTEHRECVVLRLSPNERHAAKERAMLSCPVEIVGVPRMDQWANRPVRLNRKHQLVVAVSFHFDATVCPETRSAWRYYIDGLAPLAAKYKVLGHAHPRIFRKLRGTYARLGIKPVEDFDEVLQKADIYVCDNSSSTFEFAFTGKPVILMNCPYYRKWVTHEGNPRFWEYADIGYNTEKPSELIPAVEWTYANWHMGQERQREIIRAIYSYTDGKCGERAATAIMKHLP